MARDIDEDVYRLVVFEKRMTDLLKRMPPDAPARGRVEADLQKVQQELANIKPEQFSAFSHGLQQGTAFGQEGRIKGGMREIRELLGGPESDYDSRVKANELVREAAKKEHPWTYGISEYALPMLNPLDPVAAATSGIIKYGGKALGKLTEKALPKGAGVVSNIIEHVPGGQIKEIGKESHLVKAGLEGAGKVAQRLAIKDSVARGAVSSALVGFGSMQSDKPLSEQVTGVVLNSVIGGAFGGILPIGLNAVGKGMKGVGNFFNNKWGESLARLPDNMVKKSVANLLKLNEEQLANVTPEEIGWIRQYIEAVNARGEDVVGGNRERLINFMDEISGALTKKNQNLIDLSVDEGKSISLLAMKNGIKSQFKGDDEKKLVELTFQNFMKSFPPSKGRVYTPPGQVAPRSYGVGNATQQIGEIRELIDKDPLFFTSSVDERVTARDVYDFQNHLVKYIKDHFSRTGASLPADESIKKRVYEKIVNGASFTYKHLEPDIGKKAGHSMAKNAAEARKLLSLRDRLETAMNKEEAKQIKEGLLGTSLKYGTGSYLASHIAHVGDPLTVGLTMGLGRAALKAGQKLRKGQYMPQKMRYNLGTGLSGEVPIMMGGAGARPIAASLDAYKNAQQANPPGPPPPPPEMEEEDTTAVPDFSGFGSSDEWLRSQLGK